MTAPRDTDSLTAASDLRDVLSVAARAEPSVDASITAYLNRAAVRPYPPATDFGPQSRWQFWSRDGAHFLGNESKFKVETYTSSMDSALKLFQTCLPPEARLGLQQNPDETWSACVLWIDPRNVTPAWGENRPTAALAVCAAVFQCIAEGW